MQNLQYIKIVCNNLITDTELEYISRMQNLLQIDIRSCDSITITGLAYFIRLQNLQCCYIEEYKLITKNEIQGFCAYADNLIRAAEHGKNKYRLF